MLARVLLHMVATAPGIDAAADRRSFAHQRGVGFQIVNDLTGHFVLGDFVNVQPRGGAVGKLDPAGVVNLAAAGGIKRRAVERHGTAAVVAAHGEHAAFKFVQEGIGVVETVRQNR